MIENIPLVLAQAAPAVDPTGGFFDLLLNKGVLGGAVALLIFLLIRRDSDLQKSQEGRLTDAKVFSDIVKNHTAAMVQENSANEERNRALEVAARAAEKSALVIEQMSKEIERLNTELNSRKRASGG